MKTPESIALREGADLIERQGLWCPGKAKVSAIQGIQGIPHCVLTSLSRTAEDPKVRDRCYDALIKYLHLEPDEEDKYQCIADWSDAQWPDVAKVITEMRRVATTLERIAR